MSWHSILPYDRIQAWYRKFRAELFSAPRPTGKYIVVNLDVENVRSMLGARYYAPNWEFSYYKRGEVLNLARVEWYYDDGFPEHQWWQVHVRGWRQDGQLWLKAHWELEPTEAGREHILGEGFSAGAGRAALEKTLKDADVDYEVKSYEER